MIASEIEYKTYTHKWNALVTQSSKVLRRDLTPNHLRKRTKPRSHITMDIVVWLQSESRVVKKKVKLHHADPEELQKARPPNHSEQSEC